MTVLVTRHAGFLGSHLVDSLVAHGEQVRILVADKDAVAEAAKGCGTQVPTPETAPPLVRRPVANRRRLPDPVTGRR